MSLFFGVIHIRITAGSPEESLSCANAAGIVMRDIRYVDDLTLEAKIEKRNLKQLQDLMRRRGERLEIKKRFGIYWQMKALLHRPVLVGGMLLMFLLTVFLPGRVLFVQVEGNRAVERSAILNSAEKCGIYFGASRREVRSEQVKNALLAAIPELQWAGVNTYGCVAVISVRERSTVQPAEEDSGVCSIVAARDGVILESTVTKGNALCKVGQAVKEGQVLISGYTDYGICIKGTRAEGEIFAQTLRKIEVVAPLNSVSRGEITDQNTRYSLLVGKNLIKFYKDSGISDMSCAKMYSVKYLTLPGGYELPVALVTEKLTHYAQESSVSNTDSFQWLKEYSEQYLQGTMVAGKILQSVVTLDMQGGLCQLYGEYACSEMIGRIRNEEILQRNGKNG